jgi:SAM-dependent methyltransferase
MRKPKWNAESIIDKARAFQEARILLTGVELDLFTRLARQGHTALEVARALRTDERATRMLLDALTAMGLLTKSKAVYHTARSVAPLLDARAEHTVLPMARHLAHLWQTWTGLTGVVRLGKVPPRVQRDEEMLRSFICAMHVVAAPQARALVRAIRPDRARRLLDVGGGPATYTIAFLRASPGLKATLFDLPPVIEIAREQLRKAGLLSRVDLVPGDFYRDPLPGGHDLTFLSAIIHQNSLDQNRELYGKIHEALVPGGRLVVRDHVMAPSRTRPAAGAIFAINMLVATAGGGTYTLAEIRAGLEAVGFRGIKLIRSGETMDGLVEARRP